MSADDFAREGWADRSPLQDRGWHTVSRSSGQFAQAISKRFTARLDYAVAKYDIPRE